MTATETPPPPCASAPQTDPYLFPPAGGSRSDLEAICDSIVSSAALPREKSQSLPSGAYISPDFLDFEATEIFRKEWISLCHQSQLEKPGDFVRVDLCGEPLVVSRGKDGQIRVLSRVCRHRGMDLMPRDSSPDCGNQRVVLCPYHLWSYDLTGRLVGVPEMQEADGFDRTEVSLHEFRSEIWEGFIFVNLDGNAPPLVDSYAGLKEDFIGKWNLSEGELVWSQHWECDFNWKILLENFMEAYHHIGAHRTTLEPFLPAKGCWTEAQNENFSVMHLPLRDDMAEEIRKSGDAGTPLTPFTSLETEDYTEWWVYLGFPNFLIFNAPDRTYWYRLLPTGPETSSLLTTMIINPDSKDQPDYEEVFKNETEAAIKFHLEDMVVCEATHKGMRSLAYEPGRLSHLEEPIWHFQKYLSSVIQRVRA